MAKEITAHGKKWLIFIDTNIFLDFYRIRGDIGGLSLLNHINENHDRIITSNQVEMEYKKNRQRVIIESLERLKTPDWSGLAPPAFLSEAQPANIIARSKNEIIRQHKKLKQRVVDILRNPSANDQVYQTSQRLFKQNSPNNLNREKNIRYHIRRLARKRYLLGYPPRKDKDTSIGDAINWEWIINCAHESGKNVIIVSRDTDYGVKYDQKLILNDWLSQEFKSRVSRRRKIILTDRLAEGFKKASVKISQKEERQEKALIQESSVISHLNDKLTRAERLMFILHQREQMSVKEIAMALDLPESQVSKIINDFKSKIYGVSKLNM